MRCEDGRELITGLVDGELSDAERGLIESHLRNCLSCQLIYRQETVLKREIRIAGERLKAPVELYQKVLTMRGKAPVEANAPEGWRGFFQPLTFAFRPAFVIALLLLVIPPSFYLYRSFDSSIALAALQTHARVIGAEIPVMKAPTPGQLGQQLSHSVEGRFAPMGYDLSMASLHPTGGARQNILGREVLVTLYEGDAPSLTCHTFLGSEKDVPRSARAFFDQEKGLHFYTFSGDGVNAVLHREGTVICILVSKMPLEDLLGIARAKARRT